MSLLRLGGVDVVVGVHARRRRGRPAMAITSLMFMLRAGARAGLEDVDRELVVVRAVGDRVGGRRDRAAPGPRERRRARALTVAAAALIRASARIVRGLEGGAADREVLDRPLGLGPPQGVAPGPRPRPCVSCSVRVGCVFEVMARRYPAVAGWRLRCASRSPGRGQSTNRVNPPENASDGQSIALRCQNRESVVGQGRHISARSVRGRQQGQQGRLQEGGARSTGRLDQRPVRPAPCGLPRHHLDRRR